jgi:hypothetical protein
MVLFSAHNTNNPNNINKEVSSFVENSPVPIKKLGGMGPNGVFMGE